MGHHRLLSSSVLAAALAVGGCKVNTDLGVACVLVKKAPADAGVSSVPISEEDLAGQVGDFISFGSAACEDYICVRHASYPRAATGDAWGYCSRPCSPTSPSPCPVEQGDPMSCRALILDDQTIGAICNSDDPADKEACRQLLGGSVRSSYYCVKNDASNPDAGS